MRPWLLKTQVVIVVLMLSIAGTGWVMREEVAAYIAAVTDESAQGSSSSLKKDTRSKALPVIVQRVDRRQNDEVIAAIGTARARRSVTLFAKSEGEIVALEFSAGDRVRQGQVLLKLDSAKAEIAVGIAKKTVEEMQQKLGRSQYLQKRRVGSGASVEDATIVLERARLEVRQAEELLQDRTLVAPFDGVVGIAKVEIGDRVREATEIVSLDDRSELLVEFVVPEQFLSQLRVGDSVSASTPSYAGREFLGRIGYIDSRVDITSRTVMVRAVIPNSDDLLRPGMSFAIQVKIKGNAYPVVPELALQWRSGSSYVWVVENDTVRQVPVRLVKRRNSIVFLDGELAQGELVVVEGVQRLRSGKTVTFEPPPLDSRGGASEVPVPPKSSARSKSERKG